MPGRTPQEAVQAFLEPLQDIISCVAHAKITLSPDGRHKIGRVHGMTLNNGTPVALKGSPRLLLRIQMQYEIVPLPADDERGKWKVSTRAYNYELQTDDYRAVFSYHWHPTSRVVRPHIHIGTSQLAKDAVLTHKHHMATDRVSLESVVRVCIEEAGVEPLRPDWDQVLTIREGNFELYRRWSSFPPREA